MGYNNNSFTRINNAKRFATRKNEQKSTFFFFLFLTEIENSENTVNNLVKRNSWWMEKNRIFA